METDLARDSSDTTGSMMDVPKSLLAEIKALEEQLTVKTDKLKAITDHFVKELEKGKSIPMLWLNVQLSPNFVCNRSER